MKRVFIDRYRFYITNVNIITFSYNECTLIMIIIYKEVVLFVFVVTWYNNPISRLQNIKSGLFLKQFCKITKTIYNVSFHYFIIIVINSINVIELNMTSETCVTNNYLWVNKINMYICYLNECVELSCIKRPFAKFLSPQ